MLKANSNNRVPVHGMVEGAGPNGRRLNEQRLGPTDSGQALCIRRGQHFTVCTWLAPTPSTRMRKDLQYDYACQQVYLLRGVDLQGQPALGKCRAEALAFGFISARPRGVKRSSSLICFQVIPRNGGRRVPLALWMAWPQSGYPGQQPSVTCFSRERQSCSSWTRICKLVGRVRHDDPGEMKAWSEY